MSVPSPIRSNKRLLASTFISLSVLLSACSNSDDDPADSQPNGAEPALDGAPSGVPVPNEPATVESDAPDASPVASPDTSPDTSPDASPDASPVASPDASPSESPEQNNPGDEQVQAPSDPVGSNTDTSGVPASDVDFSGGNDDSPTLAESLSLVGPSTKDPDRGAGPPSTPTNLTRLIAGDNWIEFTWAPSVDDQAVKAYEIYRDGVLIETVEETQFQSGYEFDYLNWINSSYMDCNFTRFDCSAPGVQPQIGASYAYSVAAVDNEGMRSARSEEIVLSTAIPSTDPVDLTGYTQIFAEEFNDTKLDISRWKTSLPWGPDDFINAEKQYFVNILGTNNPFTYDPFVFTGDTLQITGIETPADQLEAAKGQPFLSGVLTSSDYFEMTYGYVEMSAKVAKGSGLLSTFYLFNQNYDRNKPEIDIVEYIGTTPQKAFQTYHYYDSNRIRYNKGEKHSSPTMEYDAGVDLSDGFHTYSVLWEPGLVIWYIDGKEVRRIEGVRVSDEPMNIVTQLVMGSEWIGDPDPAAVPAVLEIDYIRAWQKP